MRKSTWMAQLERALSREGMTGTEKRIVLNYYEEMYQDRFDDGAAEEDIIKEFGFPEDVAQSVREESDECSRKEAARFDGDTSDGARKGGGYGAVFDEPARSYESRNYEVESQAYYRPAPAFVVPEAGSTPPDNGTNKKYGVSAAGIVKTIVYIMIAIALFATGLGLTVGGIAVIIAAFATIAFSAGIWLITFGIGLMLAAIGSLLFAAAIKLMRSAFKSAEGGAK